MSKPKFTSYNQLAELVKSYFTYIAGEFQLINADDDRALAPITTVQKNFTRQPEPPTLAGFAFFLGFNSMQAFDDYLANGKFSTALQQGLLQIEAAYEKKLHNNQSATGTIFLLKTMGRSEKKNANEKDKTPKKLTIKVEVNGPKVANSELNVLME